MVLVEARIKVGNIENLHVLFGNLDENILKVENEFNVKITARSGEIVIIGNHPGLELAQEVLKSLISVIAEGEIVDKQKVDYFISMSKEGKTRAAKDLSSYTVCVSTKGKSIKPKTLGQENYVKAIEEKDVVFGIGPAGTGKTYLAVAMAIRAFKNEEVSRIVITRPAIEAGESLGFLPGDLQMKIDPYLRPLHDALFDILGAEKVLKYRERGLIEVAPLAYMRGRTLDNSFIILDEAQNTTNEQMKMFLTRFGFGSKVIVNGDVTQIDLPQGKKSGLNIAREILEGVDGIEFVYFTEKDVVRHSLVRKIIKSYERFEDAQEKIRIQKEKEKEKLRRK